MTGANSERYENSSLLFEMKLRESEKQNLQQNIQNNKDVVQIWTLQSVDMGQNGKRMRKKENY